MAAGSTDAPVFDELAVTADSEARLPEV